MPTSSTPYSRSTPTRSYVENLTIEGGLASDSGTGSSGQFGFAEGDGPGIRLDREPDERLGPGNEAEGPDGNLSQPSGTFALGGGIFTSRGSLLLDNSQVTSNTAKAVKVWRARRKSAGRGRRLGTGWWNRCGRRQCEDQDNSIVPEQGPGRTRRPGGPWLTGGTGGGGGDAYGGGSMPRTCRGRPATP